VISPWWRSRKRTIAPRARETASSFVEPRDRVPVAAGTGKRPKVAAERRAATTAAPSTTLLGALPSNSSARSGSELLGNSYSSHEAVVDAPQQRPQRLARE
jgi:hypothetical protein